MTDLEVVIRNGALDSWKNEETESVVLRGTIDPSSLLHLRVADYQREILSSKKIAGLKKALRTGRVPDIELGMRGETFTERESGVITLQDPVFIVDGLQRVTAGKELMVGSMGEPPFMPHIGALIHFHTTEEWERARFDVLNLTQTKLSPNVTLRNMRHTNPSVAALYALTTAPHGKFVLCGKVCWEQSLRRSDLLTANVLMRSIGMLHSHLGPGRGSSVTDMAQGMQKIREKVGPTNFRNNSALFFDLIDDFWGVKRVAYREGASYLKHGFLLALAKLFSDHMVFWDGPILQVKNDYKVRLAQFPVSDPAIVQMASSGSTHSVLMLFQHLLNHVNHGRRTRRLVSRNYHEELQINSEQNDDTENGLDDE